MLRMTTAFLQWCRGHAPKNDGRKLRFNRDGSLEESELAEFDAHLWRAWKNKHVCVGVAHELEWEVLGRCGHCDDACDVREDAHIDRLNIELDHHCQHPHNLLQLCPNCHSRYDVLKTIGNLTIKHRKEQALSRLMEAVDRDVGMQREIRKAIKEASSKVVNETLSEDARRLLEAQSMVFSAETTIAGSVSQIPSTPQEAKERLTTLSGALSGQSPITFSLLNYYVEGISNGVTPETGDDLDIPFDDYVSSNGECLMWGEQSSVDCACCWDCDEDAPAAHTADIAIPVEGGGYMLYVVDQRGEHDELTCECGAGRFDVEFYSMCGGCQYRAGKIMDE